MVAFFYDELILKTCTILSRLYTFEPAKTDSLWN